MATTEPLNVIALVSGGKDSMYSLLHCIAQGHKIIALANLSPEPSEDGEYELDEVPKDHQATEGRNRDSFMFQTAGHALIPLYAQCFPGIPLYRSAIYGQSSVRDREYKPSLGDEVEDMRLLLANVILKHPEANAVSSGAILSTYQRTRVEDVATRLGLVSLAYLWQYTALPWLSTQVDGSTGEVSKIKTTADPAALLRHMAAAGMDARIIKVASAGLDESFLWKNLCEQKTILRVQKAMSRFGGSVLGEGGEFETLAVGGPSSLWKKAIKVNSPDMSVERADGGETWLSFTGGHVEDPPSETEQDPCIPAPAIFDPDFRHISMEVQNTLKNASEAQKIVCKTSDCVMSPVVKADIHSCSNVLVVSNITESNSLVFVQQASQVCQKLVDILSSSVTHRNPADFVIHTVILLRRMADFAVFNAQYNDVFASRGLPLPPSRVTIACGECMPKDSDVVMSAIATRDLKRPKKGLHIQSRSFWAPANIGPYSQAKSMPLHKANQTWEHENSKIDAELVYIAGQIPLVPASMEMYPSLAGNEAELGASIDIPSSFNTRVVLALQHLWRIGIERGVGFWTGAVAYIARGDIFEQKANIVRQAWLLTNRYNSVDENGDDSEEDSIDVWDRIHLGQPSWTAQPDEETKRRLPDWSSVEMVTSQADAAEIMPPCIAVEIDELPRGAEIEWQSYGFTAPNADCQLRYSVKASGLEPMSDGVRLKSWKISAHTNEHDIDSERQSLLVHAEVTIVEIYGQVSTANAIEIIAHIRHDFPLGRLTTYTSQNHDIWLPLGVVIPCRRIVGHAGTQADAVVFINAGC